MLPPDAFNDEMTALWEELEAQLPAPLTKNDGAAFEMCVRSLAMFRKAADTLAEEGFLVEHAGRTSMHPAGRILATAEAAFGQWCKRFGLSPLDRMRLKIQPPKPPNPMAKFFEPRPPIKPLPKPRVKKSTAPSKPKVASNG